MSGEGDHVTFPWESPPWDFAKPDNSAGNVGVRLGKKIACSSSHAQAAAEKEVDPVLTRKRTRDVISGGDKSRNGELAASEGKAVGESDHDIHIWTERERRKKMRDMFANLHALLPHIPPKVADKSTIVDEAVNHIKNLEDTLQNLQKQKHEKYHCTAVFNCEPSTTANSQSLACNLREAFLASQGSVSNLPISSASSSASSPVFRHPIAFQTWSSPNVVLNICGDEAMISVCSLKKPGLFTAICYVLEKYKIQVVSAQMSSDYSRSLYMIQAQVAGASDQQAKVLSVEELYKQAATEIMVWTTS